MKNILFICTLIFCGLARADKYEVLVQFGDKRTDYKIDLGDNGGTISESGIENKTPLKINLKDSLFLNTQISAVFSNKSNDKNFCSNSYVATFDIQKDSQRLACIKSKTEISKAATQLSNSLVSAFRFF